MIEKIRWKLGGSFDLDYTMFRPSKKMIKCSIGVRCTNCLGWQSVLVESLCRRQRDNTLPYKCAACTTAIRMKTDAARSICRENTKKLWAEKRDILTKKLRNLAKDPSHRQKISDGILTKKLDAAMDGEVKMESAGDAIRKLLEKR